MNLPDKVGGMPVLGACSTCAALGHTCPAVEEFDGKLQCIFCADGDKCPALKQRPAPLPAWQRGKRSRKVRTYKEAVMETGTAVAREAMVACQCKPDCTASSRPGKQYAWGHKPKPEKAAKQKPAAKVKAQPKPKSTGTIAQLEAFKERIEGEIAALQTELQSVDAVIALFEARG